MGVFPRDSVFWSGSCGAKLCGHLRCGSESHNAHSVKSRVGSAAQHVLQNYEHPMDQLAAETGAHNAGGEFVTKHWREIEAVAKALFERRDMSVEEVTKLLKQ
jgi:hypothetical protein